MLPALIFGIAVTLILSLTVLFYCLDMSKSTPAGADTSSALSDKSDGSTSAATDTDEPDNTDEPSPPDTEPHSDGAEKQAELDAFSAELSDWIEKNTPLYYKDAETDESGEEISPASSYRPRVAFYYRDITSGFEMKYMEDSVFFAASVIKEPYVLWLLRRIEEEEKNGLPDAKYNVENVFVYTEDKYKPGSGVIQASEFGTEYTYLDLMRLTVTQSDNIAFAELRRIFGMSGFNEYMNENGIVNPPRKLYSVSASDAAKYMCLTYEYFSEETKYSALLRQWMLATNHRIMIPSAVKPTAAANKYGWDSGAYHDTAIVFDENPYVLVILTELDHGTAADNAFIRSLAGKINEIHKTVFDAAEQTASATRHIQ